MAFNMEMAAKLLQCWLASGGTLGHQHTLASAVSVSGIGLHTGVTVNLRLCPAPVHSGIVFKRTDLEGFVIEAESRHVARVSYATSLMKKGVLLSTTEHLLSALAGLGVDNAVIEIDNLELPIVDGSALPFVKAIREAGLRRQRARRTYAKILKPIELSDGVKKIAVYPSESFTVSYSISFPHAAIGTQLLDIAPNAALYETDIAPARTFGFLAEVEMLLKNGLVKGGSMDNVIVLDKEKVLNPEGLRFPDEFCRHKILDLIGDLSMLGPPIIGHVVAERAGHALHAQLVSQLLRRKDSWTLTTDAPPRVEGVPSPFPTLVAAAS
jgi:UDP-3-O-[3-hydroxymyristoyl] N-acetylglucosamine deacetylase